MFRSTPRFRHCTLILIAILGTAFAPRQLFGFGATGHRVVGRIAEHHLSDAASQRVKELIGPETLAEVAMWPDDIGSDDRWSHTAPWHFVSIEDGDTYETSNKWQKPTVLDWVNESIGYRKRVYTKPDSTVSGSYRYSYENLPLVKLRLGQAGVRLAGLLNEVFAD